MKGSGKGVQLPAKEDGQHSKSSSTQTHAACAVDTSCHVSITVLPRPKQGSRGKSERGGMDGGGGGEARGDCSPESGFLIQGTRSCEGHSPFFSQKRLHNLCAHLPRAPVGTAELAFSLHGLSCGGKQSSLSHLRIEAVGLIFLFFSNKTSSELICAHAARPKEY